MITLIIIIIIISKLEIREEHFPRLISPQARLRDGNLFSMTNDIFLEEKSISLSNHARIYRRPCNSRPVIPFSPTVRIDRRPTVCLYADHIDRGAARRDIYSAPLRNNLSREIVSGNAHVTEHRLPPRRTPRHRSSREMRSVPVIDRFGDIVPLGDMYTGYICNRARTRGMEPVKMIIFPRERNLSVRLRLAPAVAPKEIGDLEICTAGITFPSR